MLIKFALFTTLIAAVIAYASLSAKDWRTASRESAGLAPLPAQHPDAVVQIYAARAINWRGWFAVHTWIATKDRGSDRYVIYQVMGWQLYHSGQALMIRDDIPDRSWFGARPYVVETLTGETAESAIPKIRAAAQSYAYPDAYRLFPGPNSNSFVSHVIRSVPELRVELPPHAIGKDWIGRGDFFGPSETKTGWQFSLYGLLGLTIGRGEGIEINILGLSFGIDVLHPALKLPFVGRLGVRDGPTR